MERSKLVVGLMSGTSLDGIDAVLLRLWGSGDTTRFRQLAYVERAFPRGLRAMLLRNSVPETSRVDEIARLNFVLASLYADAVRAVARQAGIPLARIDLIGSHGQTIQHLPRPARLFGKTIRATLQIGDPSALASLTNICTVGDFRVADMALGGQGAPLVPYVDWLLFRSPTRNRIVLNIGGIANITALPRNCSPDTVRAFDAGPGNMVVDALMERFYRQRFDRGGSVAAHGSVSLDLLRWMSGHPFLKSRPPKSTGREEFGDRFIERLLHHGRSYAKEDIVATASQFTVFAVCDAHRRYIRPRMHVDDLIISGGGARNQFFIEELRRSFPGTSVRLADKFGLPADGKEAICFAILANETVEGHPSNLPSVTGARRRALLGKLCRP
jgi:anhydro-N-acetylmuramic acid kinase